MILFLELVLAGLSLDKLGEAIDGAGTRVLLHKLAVLEAVVQ